MYQQIIQSNYNNKLEEQLIKLFHSLNLPLHFNKTGYKDFTNYQRISLIVIFRRENKPIREFLKWLKESKWVSWLGLKYVPEKSTFHDWLNWFDMNLIRKIIDLSVDKSNLKVTAIDGSGIDTNFKSSYVQNRKPNSKELSSKRYSFRFWSILKNFPVKEKSPNKLHHLGWGRRFFGKFFLITKKD